jgi:hypothetical protein
MLDDTGVDDDTLRLGLNAFLISHQYALLEEKEQPSDGHIALPPSHPFRYRAFAALTEIIRQLKERGVHSLQLSDLRRVTERIAKWSQGEGKETQETLVGEAVRDVLQLLGDIP